MIRFFQGLNEKDAHQELVAIGIKQPTREQIERLLENATLKISGIPRNQWQWAQENMHLLPDIHFIPSPSEIHPLSLLICFRETNLRRLRETLREHFSSQEWPIFPEIERCLINLQKNEWRLTIPGGEFHVRRPIIMGILNTTPDSFSDGGKFASPEKAFRHAMEMLAAGAEIIDIGGESTRPGSTPVTIEEEWQRIFPVLRKLAKVDNCIISVDTCKSEVARRALAEGAHIINDISAMQFDPAMAAVAAEHRVPVVLMHIQGMPKTMQQNPHYEHLMEEVQTYLQERIEYANEQGVRQLIIDPGIGFGKRVDDNYELLRRLGELKVLGRPILLGASRKSFIGKLTDMPPEKRVSGTIAANLMGYLRGAHIFRVHDVAEARQSLMVLQAIHERKCE